VAVDESFSSTGDAWQHPTAVTSGREPRRHGSQLQPRHRRYGPSGGLSTRLTSTYPPVPTGPAAPLVRPGATGATGATGALGPAGATADRNVLTLWCTRLDGQRRDRSTGAAVARRLDRRGLSPRQRSGCRSPLVPPARRPRAPRAGTGPTEQTAALAPSSAARVAAGPARDCQHIRESPRPARAPHRQAARRRPSESSALAARTPLCNTPALKPTRALAKMRSKRHRLASEGHRAAEVTAYVICAPGEAAALATVAGRDS